MQISFPDSPEAVALMLFALLLAREETNGRPLDLFAECLRAVRGERNRPTLEVIEAPHR